jgi:hypothetical protein
MALIKKIIVILVIIVVIAVVVADAGVAVWLRNNPGKVAEVIGGRTGNKAEVGSVGGEFLFGFHIENLVVYPSDNPFHERLLRASSIKINISPASLFRRKPYPSRVTVDDFDLTFTVDETGHLVLPSFIPYANQGGTPAGPPQFPNDIHVNLSRGSIYLNLHNPSGPPSQTKMTEVAGKGIFGSDGVITIEDASGKPGFGSKPIEASGQIDPFFGRKLDLKITGKGINLWEASRSFSPFLPGVSPGSYPTGSAECDVNFKGPFGDIAVEGNLKLSSGKLGNIGITSSDLNFAYSGRQLKLGKSEIDCYGGKVNLEGDLLLDKGPAYKFTIDFKGLDINTYLEENHFYFLKAKGDFSGSFEGYGELDKPRSIIADGTISSSSGTYLAPFKSGLDVIPERFDYNLLDIKFEMANGIIALNHVVVDGKDFGVLATGTLDMDRWLNMDGQLKIQKNFAQAVPDLMKWVPLMPKNKAGFIVMNFNLEGDIMKPKFSVKVPTNIFEGFLKGDPGAAAKLGEIAGRLMK